MTRKVQNLKTEMIYIYLFYNNGFVEKYRMILDFVAFVVSIIIKNCLLTIPVTFQNGKIFVLVQRTRKGCGKFF